MISLLFGLYRQLYAVRNDFVDKMLPHGLCLPGVLPVAFPQIEEQTKGHQPHLILRKMEWADAEIEKSGKQLFVIYPTCAFFALPSLTMLRFAPL